ncbi:MAG TPA: hypothetical protein VFN38_12815, partial [Gemmatimonadaceae bacterium]|nr:hypothetical protein [Gemmatimonadaceae bacterium]
MSAAGGGGWVRAALLAGVVYFLIGRVFALPVSHVQAWRLAAWLLSGCVYAAHIGYERFGLRTPNRPAALHVAAGVAFGAFALAVAGMIHSLSTTSAIRPVWLLAIVLWPAFTALPAFVGAFVAGARLRRVKSRQAGEPGSAG